MRHGLNALVLYQAFLDGQALESLCRGQYEIGGLTVSDEAFTAAEVVILSTALTDLKTFGETEREAAGQELAAYARELACTPGLSLTDGLDLGKAIAFRRLTVIRPASLLAFALVQALCCEALETQDPTSASNTLVHFGESHMPSPATTQRFLAAAAVAGAIGSITLPSDSDAAWILHVTDACRIRFEHQGPERHLQTRVISTLTDFSFNRIFEPLLVDL